MNIKYKNVLYLNLTSKEHEFKIHEDLWKYLGGVGVGYRLLSDNFERDPLIISCGPLSGFFPYVSKACFIYEHGGQLYEKFGGGSLAMKMNFAGIDAIVIWGEAEENLQIAIQKNEVSFANVPELASNENLDLFISNMQVQSRGFFSFGQMAPASLKISKNIGISIENAESYEIPDQYNYEALYQSILDDYKRLTVEPRNNPSCWGCPMGCDNSPVGEDGLNVALLPRCLISCGYAEEIYKSIPLVYGCLSSVGYSYQHENLESLPEMIGELKTNVLNSQLETKQTSH